MLDNLKQLINQQAEKENGAIMSRRYSDSDSDSDSGRGGLIRGKVVVEEDLEDKHETLNDAKLAERDGKKRDGSSQGLARHGVEVMNWYLNYVDCGPVGLGVGFPSIIYC